MTFFEPKITHAKIFLAATALVLMPTFAQADVSTSVTKETIQRYNFNSDTGVQVNESGTVKTSTATSTPGTLSSYLQAEATAADMSVALDMEPAAGPTPQSGTASVDTTFHSSASSLQKNVTIGITPAQ